jgi:uncharacterized protein YbaR (Trm112 family)
MKEQMNKKYLNIICCPVCKGELNLRVNKACADDIIDGTLTCIRCNARYCIKNGTAILVPDGVPLEAALPIYINRESDENPKQ